MIWRWTFVVFLLLSVAYGPERAQAEQRSKDWPQWLGPDRTGVSQETGLSQDWRKKKPKIIWQRAIGSGFSGISVVGDRLYTMTSDSKYEYVVALEAATGVEIWRHKVDDLFRDSQGGDGPRSTPTVHDGVLYALSSKGSLVALKAKDGKEIWERNLVFEFGAKVPIWGFSASPLLFEGKIYLDVGGEGGFGLVVFRASDGDVLWHMGDVKAGYSSPIVFRMSGHEQIIFFTGEAIVSMDPDRGREFWRVPWKTSWDVNAATPVFVWPNMLFISSAYGVGCALYRVDQTKTGYKAHQVWKNDVMLNKMATSVLHNGYLYGFSESKLVCMEAKTGSKRWEKEGFGRGTLIYADGHLVVLGERGKLALVEASSRKYIEKGRMKPLKKLCWTVPSLSQGRLYIRDLEHLISLDVRP